MRGENRSPWGLAVVAGVIAVVLSLGYFAVALSDVFDGDDADGGSATLPIGPGANRTSESDVPVQLKVAGQLPESEVIAEMLPADASGADIIFELSDDPAAIPGRWWVVVADPAAGVSELTRAQLAALGSGATTNWSQAGGRDLEVRVMVGGSNADIARQESFLGAQPGRPEVHGTFKMLRQAATLGSGFLAMVPLAELRPSLMPVAVDGVDVVRGRGDDTAYPFIDRLTVRALNEDGEDYLEEFGTAQFAAALPKPITVVATGDVLMSRCTLAQIEASGDWGAPLRSDLGEYLAAADLALTSLDASIQDIGAPYRCIATTNLTSPPEVIEALTLAGIDGATVATNHVFDCGEAFCGTDGFLRMLELLSAANIKVVGGGVNLEAALAPAIFEIGGVRFGVLGFDDIAAMDLEATDTAPGTAPLDDDYSQERAAGEPAFYRPASELTLNRFTERIRSLKSEVDVVIVQVQSGTEDTHTPTERSIKAMRAAADAGADVVVGNQAHWVQAAEFHGNAFITYALGNFIFDQRHQPEHYQGALLELTFHGASLKAIRLLPYEIENQMRPMFVDGETELKILNDIWTAAQELPEE